MKFQEAGGLWKRPRLIQSISQERPVQLPRSSPAEQTTKTGIQSARHCPPPFIYVHSHLSDDSNDKTCTSSPVGISYTGAFHYNQYSKDNSCKSPKALHPELVQTYRQQLDPEHIQGIQDSFNEPATAICSSSFEVVSEREPTSSQGTQKIVTKWCSDSS